MINTQNYLQSTVIEELEEMNDSLSNPNSNTTIERIFDCASQALNHVSLIGDTHINRINELYKEMSNKSLKSEEKKLNGVFYRMLSIFSDKYDINHVRQKYEECDKKFTDRLNSQKHMVEHPIDFDAKSTSKTMKDAGGYYHYENGEKVYQSPPNPKLYDDDL